MPKTGTGRTTPENKEQSDGRSSLNAPVATQPSGSGTQPAIILTPDTPEAATDAPDTRGNGRSSRQNSPARLSTELKLKYQSQLNRVACIESVTADLPEELASLTLSEIDSELQQLDVVHADFTATHTYFELNWPATFLDHEYFTDNIHQVEATEYRRAKRALTRARTSLLPAQGPPLNESSNSLGEVKLPDIQLKSFSGEYADWPSFKEMFEELILKNRRISAIERLHYLRSCMTTGPAELIANFPLTGSSLQPSWETLNARYENKRLLIQAQIDKLCHLTVVNKKSAKGLNKLITTVSEARKALGSMGATENLGDLILVYHVSRHMDHSTREAWETSLGSSLEYPSFDRLEEFINTRVRALERIEATAPQPSSGKTQPPKKAATAHQASTQQPGPQQEKKTFQCDCCEGGHFIVACPDFRGLDVTARRKIASNRRLCYNCLGRHSANSCKSTKGCKQCGSRHHTMLHEKPAEAVKTDNAQQSTSSAPSQ